MNKAQAKESIKLIDEVLSKHGISGPEDLKKLKETLVSEQTANEQVTLLMRARKIGLDLVTLLWNKLSKRMTKPFGVTGKVDVGNFPEKQGIKGTVSIDNLKDLEKQLQASIAELVKIRTTISKKDKIKVSNFPEVQKVKVEGLDKIKPKEVQTVKLDKEIKFPEKIEVNDIKELVEKNKKISDSLELVVKDGLKTFLAGRDDPKNPLAVRLSDGEKFYKALDKLIALGGGGKEVSANIKPLRELANGQKTIASAGTAEVLGGDIAFKSITIKALSGNSNNIYVGNSSVDSSNGFILSAGDTVSLDIDNLSDIYIDSDTSSEGVSFIYIS